MDWTEDLPRRARWTSPTLLPPFTLLPRKQVTGLLSPLRALARHLSQTSRSTQTTRHPLRAQPPWQQPQKDWASLSRLLSVPALQTYRVIQSYAEAAVEGARQASIEALSSWLNLVSELAAALDSAVTIIALQPVMPESAYALTLIRQFAINRVGAPATGCLTVRHSFPTDGAIPPPQPASAPAAGSSRALAFSSIPPCQVR